MLAGYQLAKTLLLTFVIFARELQGGREAVWAGRCSSYLGQGILKHVAIEATAAPDSCRLQLPQGVARGKLRSVGAVAAPCQPLVTVSKLSNKPPWTAPQQLTDKCRWPGSKYYC